MRSILPTAWHAVAGGPLPGRLIRLYGGTRVAFGLALAGAPSRFGHVLIGDDARKPAVQSVLRGYGTRELVLSAALVRWPGPAWLRTLALIDAADLVAIAVATGLDRRRRWGGIAVTAASAATAAVLHALVTSRRR